MITSPESNIVFTDEQTKQIEEASLRLANLQNETFIPTKLKASLNNDCVRIAKDKAYQDGVLQETISQVTGQEVKLDSIHEDISKATVVLNEIREQAEGIKVSQETKAMELTDRENSVTARESKVIALEASFFARFQDFEKEKTEFYERVTSFKNVIASF